MLTPNALRKRIEYVAKQFPSVLYETAYVTAHTVGADRDAIEKDRNSGVDFTARFSATAHQNEALVPWVAKELNAAMREVRKGRLGEREFVDLVNLLEAKLPNIAAWAEATKPDLTKLTAAEAITSAAKFEPDDATPVPQGKVIYRFADGWTVQELTTKEQIFAEGIGVQNCLRETEYGPEYLKRSQNGDIRIFSLRTPAGSPRVSMEFVIDPSRDGGGRFEQIFAKQNTSLNATLEKVLKAGYDEALWRSIQRYKPRIAEFITEKFASDPDGLIKAGAPLPAGLTSVGGWLNLTGYTYPLPAGLTSVKGSLDLTGYMYPLPDGLTSVGGYLDLTGYTYPLPAALTKVGGNVFLEDYPHPLPDGLTSVKGSLDLTGYTYPLPDGLTSVGSLNLKDYTYPLPAGLTSVKGGLDLTGYTYPLPDGLTSVGSLSLKDYTCPLPDGLTSVGGHLDLTGYTYPLPAGLTSVGRSLVLRGYNHPLPAGMTEVAWDVFLEDYPHPLPAGLKVSGRVLS